MSKESVIESSGNVWLVSRICGEAKGGRDTN